MKYLAILMFLCAAFLGFATYEDPILVFMPSVGFPLVVSAVLFAGHCIVSAIEKKDKKSEEQPSDK